MCLMTADTTFADVIGTTYFNILGPPSFTLADIPPKKETRARFSEEKIHYSVHFAAVLSKAIGSQRKGPIIEVILCLFCSWIVHGVPWKRHIY